MPTSHTTSPAASHTPGPVAHAMNSAEQSVQHLASAATDHAQQTLHTLMHEVSPALSRVAEQVAHLSRNGVSALQHSGHQVSHQLHQASDRTVGYIRQEPVKSVLMAAALGAALVTVFSLLSRPTHPH